MTDVTPEGGISAEIGKPTSWTWKATLTDSSDTAITGATSDITVTLIAPDGTETQKTGGDLTDEGSGVYSYTDDIETPGRHFAEWHYDGGAGLRRFEKAKLWVSHSK